MDLRSTNGVLGLGRVHILATLHATQVLFLKYTTPKPPT
jgi:hypothetical protein